MYSGLAEPFAEAHLEVCFLWDVEVPFEAGVLVVRKTESLVDLELHHNRVSFQL